MAVWFGLMVEGDPDGDRDFGPWTSRDSRVPPSFWIKNRVYFGHCLSLVGENFGHSLS